MNSRESVSPTERKVQSYVSEGKFQGLPNRADINSDLCSLMFIPGSVLTAAKAKENQEEWQSKYHDIGTPWDVQYLDEDFNKIESRDVSEVLLESLANEKFVNRYDTSIEMLDAAVGMLTRWYHTSEVPLIKTAIEHAVRRIQERKSQIEKDPNPEVDARRYIMSQLRLMLRARTEQHNIRVRSVMGEEGVSHLNITKEDRDSWDQRLGRYSPYLKQFDDVIQDIPEKVMMPKSQLDELLSRIEYTYSKYSAEIPSEKNNWRRPFSLSKTDETDSSKIEEIKAAIRALGESNTNHS